MYYILREIFSATNTLVSFILMGQPHLLQVLFEAHVRHG